MQIEGVQRRPLIPKLTSCLRDPHPVGRCGVHEKHATAHGFTGASMFAFARGKPLGTQHLEPFVEWLPGLLPKALEHRLHLSVVPGRTPVTGSGDSTPSQPFKASKPLRQQKIGASTVILLAKAHSKA